MNKKQLKPNYQRFSQPQNNSFHDKVLNIQQPVGYTYQGNMQKNKNIQTQNRLNNYQQNNAQMYGAGDDQSQYWVGGQCPEEIWTDAGYGVSNQWMEGGIDYSGQWVGVDAYGQPNQWIEGYVQPGQQNWKPGNMSGKIQQPMVGAIEDYPAVYQMAGATHWQHPYYQGGHGSTTNQVNDSLKRHKAI